VAISPSRRQPPRYYALLVCGAALVAAAAMRMSRRRAPSHADRPHREWLSADMPDDDIDRATADSFPASDPPAYMVRVIPGRPAPSVP
jgi:hypothetical protein